MKAHPERDDALPLRTPDHPRQHLRGHLSHFDVLIRETFEQDVHHPRHHVTRNAHKVSIEEDEQSGQCVQSDPP